MNARIAKKMLSKKRFGRYSVSQLKCATQVRARFHKRQMERDVTATVWSHNDSSTFSSGDYTVSVDMGYESCEVWEVWEVHYGSTIVAFAPTRADAMGLAHAHFQRHSDACSHSWL